MTEAGTQRELFPCLKFPRFRTRSVRKTFEVKAKAAFLQEFPVLLTFALYPKHLRLSRERAQEVRWE